MPLPPPLVSNLPLPDFQLSLSLCGVLSLKVTVWYILCDHKVNAYELKELTGCIEQLTIRQSRLGSNHKGWPFNI